MFSDTVMLADFNDFITPELECIIQTGKSNNIMLNEDINDFNTGLVSIRKKKTQHFNQIIHDKKTNSAKITLNDCLACSGCITSAETILIQQQSTNEMSTYLTNHPNCTLIVSVSPQAYISLATKYQMSSIQCFNKLSYFFKTEYNAKYVFSTNIALKITMKKCIQEFIQKYKAKYFPSSKSDANEKKCEIESLPILCSECPGFVCYAEKSCSESLLTHISQVKSPQQIMGVLVKKYLKTDDIYHVCIMPCFDKKLEASRMEFQEKVMDERIIKEVDCVITAVEIEQLFDEKNVHFGQYLKNDQNEKNGNFVGNENLGNEKYFDDDFLYSFINASGISAAHDMVADHYGSNGYLENILIQAAFEIFGMDVHSVGKRFRYKKLRNEDMEEVSLFLNKNEMIFNGDRFQRSDDEMIEVFRFLRAYGFRNIQNVVRKIDKYYDRRNRKKIPSVMKYDYIEILACPFGCLNGGGQLKLGNVDDVNNKKASVQREHILKMRELHVEDQMISKLNFHQNSSQNSIQQSVQHQMEEEPLFFTSYNSVNKSVNKLNINW